MLVSPSIISPVKRISPLGAGGGGGSDPDFASVVALIHFDTNLTTEVLGKTVTITGSPSHDTSSKKFGAGSMSTPGGIAGVIIPETTAGHYDFGTGDFTIEAWARTTTTAGIQQLLNFDTLGMQLLVSGANLVWDHTGGSPELSAAHGGIDDGVYHHIAVARNGGNTVKLFLDGAELASVLNSNNFSLTNLHIGYVPGFSEGWIGNIDEVRITNGVARYTAAFTPPTAPFPDS